MGGQHAGLIRIVPPLGYRLPHRLEDAFRPAPFHRGRLRAGPEIVPGEIITFAIQGHLVGAGPFAAGLEAVGQVKGRRQMWHRSAQGQIVGQLLLQ